MQLGGDSSCNWSVSDDTDWITATPSSVSGDGTVTIAVTANNGLERSGTVTIGGASVTVTQAQPSLPCVYTVVPSSISVSAAAATGSLTVSSYWENWPDIAGPEPDCPWTATASDASWISLRTPTATGVSYEISENTGTTARTGTITVQGETVTVSQAAPAPVTCPDSPTGLSSTSVSFTSAVGSNDVTVEGDSSCSWSVSADQTWVTATPVIVSGGGTVEIAVTANTGVERTGTVTIGGLGVVITQSPTVNRWPTANAGPDQFVEAGVQVTLDGTGSSDPEGDVLHYEWSQVSGEPRVTLSGADTATPTFTAPAYGSDISLSFVLEVVDDVHLFYEEVEGYQYTPDYDKVTVTVDVTSLMNRRRDLLINDWALSNDESNACTAWTSLDATAKQVFIWNTHRLQVSRSGLGNASMLAHVTKLYSVTGKMNEYDCGGAGYNRTYMSMTSELNTKLVQAASGDRSALPEWRETHEFRCLFNIGIIADLFRIGECPHRPFWFQIETHEGTPRGQIQLFDGNRVRVSREHLRGFDADYGPLRSCGSGSTWIMLVEEEDVCDGVCYGNYEVNHCVTTNYTDTVIPGPAPYNVPIEGTLIHDALSFEMDQDYNWEGNIHDSAPSCNDMTAQYATAYGSPGWNWKPSSCSEAHQSGAEFTGKSITAGSTVVRAVNITELRSRIDVLRIRYGDDAFDWTDRSISYGITPVKAVHLRELRSALDGAYVAGRQTAPTYTDETISAGLTPIKAVHMAELRNAVVALEQQETASDTENSAGQE